MSVSATSSDQRSPRDKVAASSILSGGIPRGSSFLKPPRNLGVGTKTVMPRRSASARGGRCGESGLTLMACGALPRLDVKESCGRHLRAREIRDAAVRWKGKARQALSAKPVPDPLPRGALVVEAAGHDRKWTSAPW